MTGKLILCATPIGNLQDLSDRARAALASADVIACEDTRRTRSLLAHLGIAARELLSYHDANERRQAPKLVDRIRSGAEVVLVSDAGVPGLSDPGYRLVTRCIAAGVPVEAVPGPNAAVTALSVSGLPPARYVFEGFLSRRRGERRRRIEGLVDEARTIIFYESPHRIVEMLEDLAGVLGEQRPAALARELTKMHEEVRRGSLGDLVSSCRNDPPRGEIVVVVGGAVGGHRVQPPREELARRATELMARGVPRKDALSTVARDAGVPRRAVFDPLLSDED